MTVSRKIIKKYAQLAVCIACVLLFMFVIAPLLAHVPVIEKNIKTVEDRNIEASSYYYSETDQFGPANAIMENSMRYSK